jgi:hypothetical protein
LDKLVHDDKGVTTISNDGATIMKVRGTFRAGEAPPQPKQSERRLRSETERTAIAKKTTAE